MTRKRDEITERMVDVLEAALQELVEEADRAGYCLCGSLQNEDDGELDGVDELGDEVGG